MADEITLKDIWTPVNLMIQMCLDGQGQGIISAAEVDEEDTHKAYVVVATSDCNHMFDITLDKISGRLTVQHDDDDGTPVAIPGVELRIGGKG